MQNTDQTYTAEIRCMFCNSLQGHKGGFSRPGLVSHGIGECCVDFAKSVWNKKNGGQSMWKFDPIRIKLAREANDISQAELAEKIGAAQNQVSQWETGAVQPGQDYLTKICNATGAPPKFFYINVTGGSDEQR